MTYNLCAYMGQGVVDEYFVLYALGKYSRLIPGVMDTGSNGPDNMINCVIVFYHQKMSRSRLRLSSNCKYCDLRAGLLLSDTRE